MHAATDIYVLSNFQALALIVNYLHDSLMTLPTWQVAKGTSSIELFYFRFSKNIVGMVKRENICYNSTQMY
jgi:hypothetical protein